LEIDQKVVTRRSLAITYTKVYVGGCGVAESSNHLLLGCDFSQSLCSKIRIRLGIHDPLENVVNDHALQICNSLAFGKDVQSDIHIVWLASCWTIMERKE
jgi:hypothetical protein